MDEISAIAKNLQHHAEDIDDELGKQTKLFRKVNTQMDKTQHQLDMVSAQLAKLLKTSDRGTICTVILLSVIFLVLLTLVILT